MKRIGYFTFQTTIGVHGAVSDEVRMRGFTSRNNYLQKKKLTNQYTEHSEFSTRVGTIVHR